MQVSAAKRYRRTVLLFEGEGVVTLVTRRVPTARDNGIVCVGRDSYQEKIRPGDRFVSGYGFSHIVKQSN